jgi:NADPH:quinone reductase-like Zn-dependent oxidoreductase
MEAVVWTKYGAPDGLMMKEVPKPAPGDGEVCIRVHATSVIAGDCEMRSLKLPIFLKIFIRIFMGMRAPRKTAILGQEFAGEVETAGKDVTHLKTGDKIFGATGFGQGTYAQYICLPAQGGERVLAAKPENLTDAQAAVIPVGALEALFFLRQSGIKEKQKILINGAGGSIGTIAVQLAKHFGAEVTAVDSADKLEMLRACGADHVIDYQAEDVTGSGKTYDVLFDVVGKLPLIRALGSIEKKGRLLISNPKYSLMPLMLLMSGFGSKKIIAGLTKRADADLDYIRKLAEEGEIRPVIDRRFSLEQMPAAHRYVETGRKKGTVSVIVE